MLFMGVFGLLAVAFYPGSLFMLWTALRRETRAARDFSHRMFVLTALAFFVSVARLTGAYLSAAWA